jgi:hypothetical protein
MVLNGNCKAKVISTKIVGYADSITARNLFNNNLLVIADRCQQIGCQVPPRRVPSANHSVATCQHTQINEAITLNNLTA